MLIAQISIFTQSVGKVFLLAVKVETKQAQRAEMEAIGADARRQAAEQTQTQTQTQTENAAAETRATEATAVDNQGNPIDKDGRYILEDVAVGELTDEDFAKPTRNVRLPQLSQKVDDAIGANGRPVIIKKNIFEKNKNFHKDLSAEDGRKILTECLYNPQLYGQNQKASRPYNWILIHMKDGRSAVIVEVNPTKDNIEIVNWHYLRDETLRQKESQAVKEGGLILTLSEDNAAGATANDGLVSADKVTENNSDAQGNGEREERITKLTKQLRSLAKEYDSLKNFREYFLEGKIDSKTYLENEERERKKIDEECYRIGFELGKSLNEADDFFDLINKVGVKRSIPVIVGHSDSVLGYEFGHTNNGYRAEVEDIKPVGRGVFGDIYDQFKGKLKEGIAFISKKKDGYLRGVLHRDDIGDIDLPWGEAHNDHNGKGMAHIIRKHIDKYGDFANVDEAADVISDVVENGKLREDGNNTVAIEKDNYRVVVVKDNDGNWILSAFDFVTPKKEKLKRKDAAALDTPGQPVEEAGAVTPNLSADKVTENIPDVQGKVEVALKETNTEPSQAQIESGNYKKGHVKFGGYDISIENPVGSERKGVDANGKPWSTKMNNTYGYFKGTQSVDGDHIDVFLANDMNAWNGEKVFVVDQTNTDGSFDEHKVMLGFNSKEEAFDAYLSNYDANWQKNHPGLRITEVGKDVFDNWMSSSHRKTKPFADYKIVKEEPQTVGRGVAGVGGEVRERIDGLSERIAAAEGEEKARLCSDMSREVAAIARENGIECETCDTTEEFLGTIQNEETRAAVEESIANGGFVPGMEVGGVVRVNSEHVRAIGAESATDVLLGTMEHEGAHADAVNDAEARDNVARLAEAMRGDAMLLQEGLRLIEAVSGSDFYTDQANRMRANGQDLSQMVADEVVAHGVQELALGRDINERTTNNELLTAIQNGYERREAIKRERVRARGTDGRTVEDNGVPAEGGVREGSGAGGQGGDNLRGGVGEGKVGEAVQPRVRKPDPEIDPVFAEIRAKSDAVGRTEDDI